MLFNAKDQSINKFDLATIEELRVCVQLLAADKTIKGLMICSAKDTFVVGADIKQFSLLFANEEAVIAEKVVEFNGVFAALEDLPFPTVCLIDGVALGGGFELGLACDYRVISPKARVGLPEVKLGINPGFGGTIRLPRVIGCDNAIEWIATGKDYKADDALSVGAVDSVVASADLTHAGLLIIQQANEGKLAYQLRKQEKTSPVLLSDIERLMVFTSAKGLVAAQAGPNMPAPVSAVKSIEKSAHLHRAEAIAVEAKFFARLAKTEVSLNLIDLFLGEQDLTKRANKIADGANIIDKVAVVGAGIMGGGIAYQAASKNKHVVMKDIAQAGLDQGMNEATKLLSTRVDRGRLSATDMAATLNRIQPRLDFTEFHNATIAIEAVVENLNVKQKVLAEVEQQLPVGAVLCSNTSTLSITQLATALQSPERFCGMHFFNPVHKMPLVEVIRGQKTSDATIASTVKLALDMGKSPIVVNDCVGFYVNRVLFPYFAGFNGLVRDGADFIAIDKIMEKFGWPMGPAYLIDVVGIDTAHHVASIMAEAYPDRMKSEGNSPLHLLFNAKRLGQKNNQGFYAYQLDKKGKKIKVVDDTSKVVIKDAVMSANSFTDEEVIERLMIPMCLEVVRCLHEGVVSNAVDAEMGLIMGIGFPLFRGGPLHYIESMGLAVFMEKAKKYQHLGGIYQIPASLTAMAEKGQLFFTRGGSL